MLYAQFVSQVKSTFFPVVIIEGDDAFLRDDALKTLTDSLDLKFSELNSTVLDGAETTVTEIVALANSFPVMSDKRLIVVKDFLAGKKSVSKSDKSLSKIFDYCNSPNEMTCLVFLCNQSKLPLDIKALTVDCNKKPLHAVSLWVKERIESNGKRISKNLADLIADYCNCDMYKVYLSTNALLNYCDGEITAEAVELLVPKDLEVVVFDLSNSICAKNAQKALIVSKKLLEEDEPIKILGALYSSFRKMFFVLSNAGMSNELLAGNMGVSAYAISKIKEQGVNFGSKKLKDAMRICADSDIAIKRFLGNDKEILNDLVLALCNL